MKYYTDFFIENLVYKNAQKNNFLKQVQKTKKYM